jgi:hypothetical protein
MKSISSKAVPSLIAADGGFLGMEFLIWLGVLSKRAGRIKIFLQFRRVMRLRGRLETCPTAGAKLAKWKWH